MDKRAPDSHKTPSESKRFPQWLTEIFLVQGKRVECDALPLGVLLTSIEVVPRHSLRNAAQEFAATLAEYQVGVVPDFGLDPGEPTTDTLCVLFSNTVIRRQVSSRYIAALMQVSRDGAFLAVKGTLHADEENWLSRQLNVEFEGDEEDQSRIWAWVRLLRLSPPPDPESAIRHIARQPSLEYIDANYQRYLALCSADGPLNQQELYALSLLRPGSWAIVNPVTVRPQKRAPLRPTSEPEVVTRHASAQVNRKPLDMHKVRTIQDESETSGKMLALIFSGETDNQHSGKGHYEAALKQATLLLEERTEWSRDELFSRWKKMGLMPEAILEELNERALQASGELVLDGEDRLTINALVLIEIIKGLSR